MLIIMIKTIPNAMALNREMDILIISSAISMINTSFHVCFLAIHYLFVRMSSVYIESCNPFTFKSAWVFNYSSRHSLPTIQYSLG